MSVTMLSLNGVLTILAICSSLSHATVAHGKRGNYVNNFEKNWAPVVVGALYPQSTETRALRTLDGIWNFRKSPVDADTGYRHKWYAQDLEKTGPVIPMPVPSSFNDVGADSSLRDHCGLVWYDRRFYVPAWWQQAQQRIWLRFSSVHYSAKVWLNGQLITYHEIGHLPFEVEITNQVLYNSSNLLTVVVDNALLEDTVPQGHVSADYDNGTVIMEQRFTFDFFNYAGIHRSVFLYTTPQLYIDDIAINTDIQGNTGFVMYNITFRGGKKEGISYMVQLFDKNDTQVAGREDFAGLLEVPYANFWWPYLMNPNPGYLYTLKATLVGPDGEVVDTYSLKVGIRKITWTNTAVLINGQPIYFKGFGMHEDSDFRGKGWDQVLWVKNFNLIRWVGANAFRTSHYPYAEEIYQLADQYGIMIIDECPIVSASIFSDKLLVKHKQSLTELIRRDKNHPSVVMWSIANEPDLRQTKSEPYFSKVASHVRSMDETRPVTLSISYPTREEKNVGKCLDVISFNRYNGWYTNTGMLYKVKKTLVNEAHDWYNKYHKPVLVSEYGADTIAGFHSLPEFVWSEEFQVAMMSEHFKAFDDLRKTGWFIGEFVWNFADFNTPQAVGRAGGNKKGIFTRSRQPKWAAHHLRARYLALSAAEQQTQPLPEPLYISDN